LIKAEPILPLKRSGISVINPMPEEPLIHKVLLQAKETVKESQQPK